MVSDGGIWHCSYPRPYWDTSLRRRRRSSRNMDVFIFNHVGVTFEEAYQTFIQSRRKNGDKLWSPIGRQLHLVIKTDGK